ncbi:TetR/AcrR family transcriptional regulator [Oscillospiraceae bacterium OttesenSCG-928-F05]|nr:TetR/AcrR family transcriptional regulator [Oscillospiraceae bacterium OttesenSCG-928-F05]
MKENQKIRISRQCLRDGLIRLLDKKSIHKISVREICEEADINRTTFYKYYGNQFDLLKDIEDVALSQVDNHLADADDDDFITRVENVLLYIQSNLELFRLLINNTVDTDFPQRIISLPLIEQILSERLNGQYTPEEFEYIYGFIVSGGFSIVKNWINKEVRESPAEIAGLMARSIPKMFA